MDLDAKAIPFIVKNNKTEKYEISNQAQIFLKKIQNPVSIVTVAGLYRTGKSYLLNRVILNKSQGFNVGPTINPCTKGLWIWNQPISTQDNKSVLVVDTQGLGALDQQANHDMKIFSLAVLLSTTFIYNSVGNIDQNALQNLSLVLNLIKNIDNQEQSSRPSFIWVVRDFSLQLIDQKGNCISPKQYLQMALNSEGLKQSQKSQIRKNITKAFSDRDCFTFYKPLIDQNKLQRLDTIPLQELRPQFVSQSMALRKKIFSNLKQIKLLNSKGLRGVEYVCMIKKYLAAINQGKVPNIIDTWTFIKEQKGRQVSEQLIEVYSQKIKNKIISRLPIKFNNLEQILNDLWQQIRRQYISLTYENTSIEQIQDFFQRIKGQIKSTNQQQMRGYLKNLLNKQYESFSKKVYSDYYNSIQDYIIDIDKNFKQMIINTYSQKLQGLNVSISSFLQKKYMDVFKYFSSKLNLQIKRLMTNKEENQKQYKIQLQNQKLQSANYHNQLKNKITQLDTNIIELGRKNEQNQKIIEKQKILLQRKQKQFTLKYQSNTQSQQKLKQENQQLKLTKNKLQKQIFMIKKQNDKQIALLKQKNQYLTSQNEEQSNRYQQLKKIMDQRMHNYDQQKKKFFSTNQNKLQTLIHENQQKTDKIFELQHKLLQLKQQFNEKMDKLQKKQLKLIQQKQKMKQNLINDFSNKKQTHGQQIQILRDQSRKYQQQLQMSFYQKNQLQNKLKQLTQQLKHIKYSSQKQIAIHLQRIQFYQVQIKQLKTNNQDMKKNYQLMIQNIQSSTKNIQQKYQTRINELNEQNQTNFKNLQKQYSQKLYELKKQLQLAKASKQDLQIQLSLQRKKVQNKQKEFKQSYGKLQSMYKNLNEKFTTSERDFHDLSQQKQIYFTMRIKQLQRQIQQVKQKARKQVQQSQRSSEQALAVLKNYTEIQRNQWEKRLQDQKEKNNKKLSTLKHQYEKKLLEQKQILQDENSMLEDKIQQMQKYFNQTLQNMKYDHDIEVQKMSNQFMQQKVQINKKNALLNQQIQLTKMNMQNQIDQMKRTYELNINNIKKQLQTQLKNQQIKYKQQRQFIQTKYENLKKSNKQVQQQNLILKNQLDKQKLLYRQKQSSYLKNINDLQERLSNQLFNHTKTIQDITNSNNMQRKRLNNQIDMLKSIKSKIQDQKSALEIQKQAIQTKLNSKITYLQGKIKTNKSDYDDLMNKFQLTSNFLNKKIQSMKKQKQQINYKIKNQFDQQISIKEDTYKKQIKQFNDRIYRLQTQNKSLRDKVILLQVKLSSQPKLNLDNSQFQQIQLMKQEYIKRQEQYKKLIQKLKRQNKRLKQQKQILQVSNTYEKQKNVNNYQRTIYKDKSQRDSIINGLNQYSNNNKHDYSKSRINLDNSKLMNTSNIMQNNNNNSQYFNTSNMSILGQKNIYNNNNQRKSNLSPINTMKKYSNNYRQQEDYSTATNNRYY